MLPKRFVFDGESSTQGLEIDIRDFGLWPVVQRQGEGMAVAFEDPVRAAPRLDELAFKTQFLQGFAYGRCSSWHWLREARV